jgi:hypothetical protein
MKASRKVNPTDLRYERDLRFKRWVASYSWNRHIHAYMLDRNPRHIAAAWRDFRKHKKVAPDESVFVWIDCLADAVLNPPPTIARPKQNTERDLDIWREVQFLKVKKKITMTDASYGLVGAPYGLSAGAVKMAVLRVQEAFDDPGRAIRAFRKK